MMAALLHIFRKQQSLLSISLCSMTNRTHIVEGMLTCCNILRSCLQQGFISSKAGTFIVFICLSVFVGRLIDARAGSIWPEIAFPG